MPVTVKVDADRAIAKFSPAGIPVQVRENLRRALPPLARELVSLADANLANLKSRSHLQVKGGPQGVMVENAQGITARVEYMWTDPEKWFLPQVLETGAKPHVIVPKFAKALRFFWPVMNAEVFFKRVNHPGFSGIHYLGSAFAALRGRIQTELEKAVRDGTQA